MIANPYRKHAQIQAPEIVDEIAFEDIDEGAGEEPPEEDDPKVRAAIEDDIETLIEYFKEHPGKESRDDRRDLFIGLKNLKLDAIKENWGLLSDVNQWTGDDLYKLMDGIDDGSDLV
jgi:hypothetical protein